ncbi:SAM-dependent methyltransferase [Actinomadura geliboluensis]|uniref:SAM-dependent methyltransferase n=1 Tax=Actinomadura geliboluensis TaxID=882440 RepID=UPI0036931314
MSDQVIIKRRGGPVRQAADYVSRMFRYFTASTETRVRSFYELNDRRLTGRSVYREFLGINSLYVNYGYWTPDRTDHDEACEALAEELGAAAGITAGDQVLDVGFGYAEQDLYWLETRKPARIIGINVTPSQVEVARERARERGVSDRVDLRVGSATSLPFEAGSFDRVVALESAVHFDTRQKFFEEAFRVLRPGGVLATADLVPRKVSSGSGNLTDRLEEWRRSTVIPRHNWYPRPVYAERLREAGFVDVEVRDVTGPVLMSHAAHTRRRFEAPENQRFNAFQLRGMRLYLRLTEKRAATLEYVIAVARKPGGDATAHDDVR